MCRYTASTCLNMYNSCFLHAIFILLEWPPNDADVVRVYRHNCNQMENEVTEEILNKKLLVAEQPVPRNVPI